MRKDILTVCLLWLLVGVVWTAAWAQQSQSDVKFGITELEAVKQENLKLKRQLLATEGKLSACILEVDTSDYVTRTLKDHNNPEGVFFDPKDFNWHIKPVEKEDKK